MAYRWSVCLCLACFLWRDASGETVCSGNATANDVADAAGLNLSGKVVVVTGGDGGIGQAVVESFSRQKAIVVIATRNLTKAGDVAKRIAALTGGDVRARKLDLASFVSVRNFSRDFLTEFDGKLHYLINNAGMDGFHGSYMSSDGFELTFEVNYLGHFLLTELLLPALRESRPSRVVNVASTGHAAACQMAGYQQFIPSSCMKDWQQHLPQRSALNGTQRWFPAYFRQQPRTMYGMTKLLQILHAQELAQRELNTGPEAFSVAPGVVISDMGDEALAVCKEQWLNPESLFKQKPCPYEPQVGAAVIAYAALHSASNGKLLARYRDCDERSAYLAGFNTSELPLLYAQSSLWVGLSSGWLHSDEHRAVLV